MKKLIVYHGDSLVQVEGFPEGCKRSCEGALHIHPGKHKTVTDGEYEHIRKAYDWMKPKLRVVAEIGEKEIEAEKKAVEMQKAKAGGKDTAKSETTEAKAKVESETPSVESSSPAESSSDDGGKRAKQRSSSSKRR